MREGKLPLRTVLQNFINHVDCLEGKRNEGDGQYEQEFQELKLLTESLKTRPDYCCLEGEKDVNRRKNRYKDILPYDYTRVELSSYPGVPGSDYINANYIRGASGSRAYIGSQGPLPHTVPDFWRMVVECEVQVIIMASNETEGGKHKCECYWVNTQNEERQFGNVTVSFVKARQVCPDFMVRTLKIKYSFDSGKTEERTICQFHYVLWPDHGVPETVRPLLDMVRLVRDCQASETLPVLVHCSAGCGRTGTICAIDYVWGLLRAGRLTENLDLFGLVKDMRRQRVAMVQTREQYILLHRAVRELFKERLKVIDAHPYENIATDGTPLILREKESDYEELYVKPEKQDESAKPTPPTTAPSAVSTPTGSLTRYSHTRGNADYLASSSPINTLEQPLVTVPPLPMKLSKPLPASIQSSPGPHAAPAPQPSPVHSHSSPMPLASPVSFPSPSQAQISYTTPVAATFPSNILQSTSIYTSPTYSSTQSSVSQSKSNHLLSPHSNTRMGIHPSSKLEKDAENAAHKRQVTQPSLSSPITSGPQRSILASSQSYSPHPLSSGSATPTPNTTPTLLHGLGLTSIHAPAKSRTPSPRITYRKPSESQTETQGFGSESNNLDDNAVNKNDENVRRPSIAKLKELFEKNAEAETTGVRLSRSASSVTSRTNLSVHPDTEGGFRVKRKSSLGAEETLQSKKAYEIIEKSRQQNACSPPLQDASKIQTASTAPVTIVSASKPPSSPVYTSPVSRRRGSHTMNESQEDGSTSALLARVDDRPALPVKKSKSFRYARPIDSTTNTIASTRSPELARKKADINTYFSLDRSKGDTSALSKSESGSVNFIGDIPSPREGFKLSVYQIPNAPSMSQSYNSNEQKATESKPDTKPQIPPKRIIGERLKSTRLPESLFISTPQSSSLLPTTPTSLTSQTVSAMVSSMFENPLFWNRCQQNQMDKSIYDCPKDLQAASRNDYDNLTSMKTMTAIPSQVSQVSPGVDAKLNTKISVPSPSSMPKPSPTAELTQETTTNKEYVNARVVRNPKADTKEATRYVYVPLPSKRGSRGNKHPHDYANCPLSGQSQHESAEGEDPCDLYMDPQVLKKGVIGKFPVYDEVVPSSQSKSEASLLKSISKENIPLSLSAPTTPGSATTPISASTPGSADYEMMDFGESNASVDEVFETVNYELLGTKDRRNHKSTDGKRDFCSKKDLDPIARQVYQDCQDYLLHGNNKSPVPSLMPKPSEKDADKVSKVAENTGKCNSASLDTSMDVDEVKSKVNVAPQGLRTRERRNSYRQAVNPVTHNESKTHDEKPRAGLEHSRSIHKYETIWFENGKHMTRRNNPSPTSQQNLHPATRSPTFSTDNEDSSKSKGSGNVHMPVQQSVNDEHGPNLNYKSNIKDALFREKLEELHTLVNNLERQKPLRWIAASPGSVEDDANSKESGSSNSTLQSRSTTSSRSSEAQEPIYANTQMLPISRSLSSNKVQQLPPRAMRNLEPNETRSPPPLRHSRTEVKLDNTDSKLGGHSPLINGNSMYGTIATTTFRGKQSGNNPASPSFQNMSQNQGKPPSPYHGVTSTATLPARTTISPTPYHNIPPPKGFGGGISPSNSPNPNQALQQNQENRETQVSSPYYNMAAFTSGRPNQTQRNVSGQEERQGIKSGEEWVRLRRPGVVQPPRTDTSGCSSSDSRGSEGAPVAPPRIKRNSSAGLPRHSAVDSSSFAHNDWHCLSDAQDNYRQTILTAKQSWTLSDEEPPPAVPAKTAAAYQYPDPPPPPPHSRILNLNHLPPSNHSSYTQPPPPKPMPPQSSQVLQYSQHSSHLQSVAVSSPSSLYQTPSSLSPSHHPQHLSPSHLRDPQHSSHHPQHHSPQQFRDLQHRSPEQEAVSSHRAVPIINLTGSTSLNNNTSAASQNKVEDVTANESSSESSDDEGIFHKFSANNIFKKWRTNNKQVVPPIPSSPKSAFSPPSSRDAKEEKDFHKDIKGVKESNKETILPSPASPKPLVKAFGKLKLNPKSVAANFKSYLSQRGDKVDGDSSDGVGGALNGAPGGGMTSSPGTTTRGIQKSASSGPAITAFSQVAQDYKYPTPIPKKPAGPRDMPAHMRGSTPTNSHIRVKDRPRQQYL
ncbi:uncharacterized protein [Procambarus clarkii]|uniref:uncharacterized protein isoform X2 n=1 Tax=Procambarus clarkii TaxID=6728 RepID=UPI003743E85E